MMLQQAAFALQSGRPQDAERIAGEILRSNAGNLTAMQVLGSALLVQGRGEEAVKPLKRAAQQTRDPAVETDLAMALHLSDRSDDAVAQFERTIKRTPPFPPAFVEFARLLAALNRRDDAMAVLREGLATAPDFAELSFELGRLCALGGKNAEARAAFERAAALRHPGALLPLARACQAERDFAQAIEVYRQLLAVRPNEAAARIGMGICLLELGRDQEALDHLRAASRINETLFGETVIALADAGRGRFWLRPSDAARALRGEGS